MNRAQRRKANANDILEAEQRVQNQLASMLLFVWIDVLWDDVEEEAIHDWVNRVIEKYNSIDDFEEFQKKVYEKTGIGIIKVDP